jgi:chemotaxis protein CheD
MRVARASGDEIVTYALGSCLGITVYDPVARVAGMLHVMLPLSTIAPDKAVVNPYMFVDTGVPKLFFETYKAGAAK